MMYITKIFFCLISTSLFSTEQIDVSMWTIAKDYMELKYLNYISIIGCFDRYATNQANCKKKRMYLDELRTTKYMFDNYYYVEMISLSGNNSINVIPNKYHSAVFLYVNCKEIENILLRSGEANLYDIKHHWLILGRHINITNILRVTQFTLDSDVHLLIPNVDQKNRYFDVFDVYNPAFNNGGSLNKTIIGKYSNENGFQIKPRGLKYTERRDMSDVELRATITLPVSFSLPLSEYLIFDGQREINTFNRFHSKLIFYCQEYHNFSLKDIQVTKSWGYLLPNNSFDGLVGQLERNETDISLSPLFFRSDRLEKIDYGRRTWIMKVAFIFRNPRVPASFTVFLKPLSLSIWLATFVVFVLSVLLYKLISRKEYEHFDGILPASWSELILFIFGTFCQQGTTLNSRLVCGRIVILFAFILSLVIYQFYSASIVSILLMKPPTPIKTPEDLLASQMECRSENILYNKDYFKNQVSLDILGYFRTPTQSEVYWQKFVDFQAIKYLKVIPERGHIKDLCSRSVRVITYPNLYSASLACKSEQEGRTIFGSTTLSSRAKDKTSLDIFRYKLKGDEGFDYFLTPQEGLKLVYKGGYAFNVELATAYPIIEKTFPEDIVCELKEVQLMRALQMFSSFQKGSPLRKVISVRLQRFAEVGILDREIKNWLPRKPVCLDKLSSSKFTVGITDLYPAFVMLFLGLIFTYLIYWMELGFEKLDLLKLNRSNIPFNN